VVLTEKSVGSRLVGDASVWHETDGVVEPVLRFVHPVTDAELTLVAVRCPAKPIPQLVEGAV
jgi:hypothetical protein